MKQTQRNHFLNWTFGLILAVLIVNLYVGSVSAWKNGSYADDPAEYNYVDHYGSHDWIADYALQALMAINSSEWQWLEDRKEIYYVGTEAPDNSGIDIILDGDVIEGYGDTTYHHVYFNEDGTIKDNEDDSAIRAKWCGDWADVSYSDGDFDKAAFYLGAMTHYIADLAMYAHIVPNYEDPYNLNFDEHHAAIEGYVNTRTNEYEEMDEFFHITAINVSSMNPYDAAIQLAWETYKDPFPTASVTRDAFWLHTNHFTGWAQTYSSRMSETNETKLQYYDRFEENLWNAISKCASSMNYICGSGQSSTETTTTETTLKFGDRLRSIPGYSGWWVGLCALASISLIVKKKRRR